MPIVSPNVGAFARVGLQSQILSNDQLVEYSPGYRMSSQLDIVRLFLVQMETVSFLESFSSDLTLSWYLSFCNDPPS